MKCDFARERKEQGVEGNRGGLRYIKGTDMKNWVNTIERGKEISLY